jgi:hypothetical protein
MSLRRSSVVALAVSCASAGFTLSLSGAALQARPRAVPPTGIAHVERIDDGVVAAAVERATRSAQRRLERCANPGVTVR